MELTSRLPLPPAIADRVSRDRKPVVAVVKLQGVITPTATPIGRGVVNLATVETALTRAFGSERLAAVALSINSPGGSPTQSALVADRIRGLAAEHDVPVIAFCEDVAASGGYWLACAADEIVAHPTSVVGSIGVVSSGFGLQGLIERLGVERRLHTAGSHKARLDPFLPEDAEDVAWLRGVQDELHTMFIDWVRERRGPALEAAPARGTDLFTGEVWTGARAVDLGLVDRLGTLRAVVEERFPDAELLAVEPRKPLLARLGLAPAALVPSLLDALEHRAAWRRVGL